MRMAIAEGFLQIFEPAVFSAATAIFILSFLIWELPRSVKIMGEEYTKGIYPETGRVLDIIIMIMGLCSIIFLYVMRGMEDIGYFMLHDPRVPVFIIVIAAVPLLIFMGYGKRVLARIDKHESMTVFFVHNFLDLAHTAFFITFSFIFITTVIYLMFSTALR
jgi:hypothetical protein